MPDLARLERRLDQAVERFERVEARLASATDGAEIVKLGQEHAELKPLVDAVAALNKERANIVDLQALESSGDAEMEAMARDDLKLAREREGALEKEVLGFL